jgi:hypothetical protein
MTQDPTKNSNSFLIGCLGIILGLVGGGLFFPLLFWGIYLALPNQSQAMLGEGIYILVFLLLSAAGVQLLRKYQPVNMLVLFALISFIFAGLVFGTCGLMIATS